MRAEREVYLMIHEYPYTDFHEMNLDWIIREMKKLVDDWASFATDVTASAHESAQPEVTVTGDLKTGIDFDFGLVKGPEGPEGPEGPQGKGLDVLGVYATLSDLQTAHPTGSPGDVYLVGSGGSYTMYVWSEDDSDWADGGPITSPSPAVTNPLMDGIADAGTDANYSRADHVHPKDSSKQDVLVSGTNIKTINSNDILGSGNITVQDVLVSGTNIKTINSNDLLGAGDISVQPTLVSGTNIKTINNESLLGNGDLPVQPVLVSGSNIRTINSQTLLGNTDIALQVPLVSGTNIKTINGNDLLGSGDLTILPAGLTVTQLWTNELYPDTVTFSAQTINIDFTGYELILVEYINVTDVALTDRRFMTALFRNVNEKHHLIGEYGGKLSLRSIISLTSSSIEFSAGTWYNTYGGATPSANACVPYTIYGIK